MSQSLHPDTLNQPDIHLPSRRFVVTVVVAFVIAIVGVCILLTGLHYDDHLNVARRNLNNILIVQAQYNQEVFREVDEVVFALQLDLEQDTIDTERFLEYYNQFSDANPLLRTILLLDDVGNVVFNSRPDEPALDMSVPFRDYFAIHQNAELEELYIDKPVRSLVDNNWSMPVSRAYYDNGDVKYVIVASISPQFWSESFDGFEALDEYIGILTHADGTILTTFPYDETLIGTRVGEQYLVEGSFDTLVPSLVDNDFSLVASASIENYPMHLIIEVANTEALFAFDGISAVITGIAIFSVISGIAVIVLYRSQYDVVRTQTETLYQININLAQEIQNRQQVEATLSDSEQHYRTVTELISDYAFSIRVLPDETMQLEWITDSFEAMLGYNRDDLEIEPSTAARCHPDDADHLEQDMQRTLQNIPTITEYRTRHKSGNYIWIRVNRRPIWDDKEGRVIRFVGAVSDITERKEAELALRENEERYRLVTEMISDYAFSTLVQEDGSFIREWITGSFYNMTGYSQDDTNRLVDPLPRTHPDDIDFVQADLARTMSGEDTVSEYRWQIESGDYIWIRVKRRAIWNADHTRVNHILSAVTDITAQKEAELALRENEERYRTVTEAISDYALSIRVHDEETFEREWITDSFYSMMGFVSEASMDINSPISRTHPDDVERVNQDFAESVKGIANETEYRTQHQDGHYICIRVKRRPIWNDDHTQVIRLIIVASDITAQKEAELALRENEEHYRLVTEMISDYAFSTLVHEDGSRTREWITDSFYTMTGYGEEHQQTTPDPIPRTHPDDLEHVQADLDRTMAGEDTVSEYRWRIASGEYIWTRVKRRALWNEDNTRVIRIIGAVTDITAQKEAEFARQQSEEHYRIVTELVSDYAFACTVHEDLTFELEWMTDSFYTIVGSRAKSIDYTILTEVHPDDLEHLQTDIRRTCEGEHTATEFRYQRPDGNFIWLRIERTPVWDEEQGRVIRFLGAGKDITAQKEAELARQESEERYRMVTEMISDYAFSNIVNEDGAWDIDWVTDSFFTITGYTPENEDEYHPLPMVTHPDDVEENEAKLALTLQGEPTTSEYRFRTKQGHYIWLRINRLPIKDETGRVIRFIGAGSDITAQKEAELARQESEERYRMVTEMISDYAFSNIVYEDGTWEADWITDKYFEVMGYNRTEFAQLVSATPAFNVHPDDVKQVIADVQRTLNGEDSISLYRAYTKSGNMVWLRVIRQAIWDETGSRVIRMVGAGSDITAEKETEYALLESEERYRMVTEMISDYAFALVKTEDDAIVTSWITDKYFDIIGYTRDEFASVAKSKQRHMVHPDDFDAVSANILASFAGEDTVSEYRAITKSGDIVWLRVKRQPIWNDDHTQVVQILGAGTNITAQKEAELTLQATQKHYKEVTDLMSDYAFSVKIDDGEVVYLEWVVGMVKEITGRTPDELKADPYSLTRLVHLEDIDQLQRDFATTLNGVQTTSQYRIINSQTKHIVWVEVVRQPIWNVSHTAIERVVVVTKDISSQVSAKMALAKSEERYRLVSELISDYVYSELLYPDQSTELEWVAGSLEKIIGVTADEVYQLGRIPNRIHPDDQRKVTEDLLNTRMGNVTVSEYRLIHVADETIHWVRESRRPIWDETEQRVIRIISAVSDISNEKQNADKLRHSEERYRILTDLMSDYVFSLIVHSDKQLEMDWFAGSFKQITGIDFSDFDVDKPQDMTKYTHPDDLEWVQGDVQQTLNGKPTISEYRIINAEDNAPRWIRVSRFPQIDKQTKKVVGILGATTNITRQKEVELALRDSEERYRLLTELMTDYAFSIRIEDDGRLYREWMVGDFKGIMGYEIPQSGYLDEPRTLSPYRENIKMIEDDLSRTLRGQFTITEYQVLNRTDNQHRWIRVIRQPIWNQERDRIIRYIGAVKNITAEKEAEAIAREADDLRLALEREKSLHELRSHFVAMVTHEFRNPLATIQSSVSLLDKYNDRLTDESKQEKYQRIYGQIKRLTNLLEDLLEVGELENHALHFSPQRVDIVSIIRDLYELYQDSIGQEHELVLRHEQERVITFGDIMLLERAFDNIMSNAIKYSPADSQVITTVALQGHEIIITIQDFGMGIPQRDYDNLFKAFYRASNVSTQPGTGLGLIIAKQAIELHKGTIDFESVVGDGTTFTITIPHTIGKLGDT